MTKWLDKPILDPVYYIMPRRKEVISPNGYYHVYNRGVNKEILFFDEKDYSFFLQKIQINKLKIPISLLGYCLMPNHYHFLATTQTRTTRETGSDNISKFFHNIQVSYAMYFNNKYKHSGYVFQGRFQAKQIERENYLQYLSCYIHYNPKEAVLVNNPVKWRYSSLSSFLSNSTDLIVEVKDFPYEGDYKKLWDSYLLYKSERDRELEHLILE